MRASTELPNTKRIETSTSGDAWSDSLWGLSDQASHAARRWHRWTAFLPRRHLFGDAGLPARPTLLVLTMLLLVGLCALLAFWGGHPHADSTGIDLLADHSSRNLNNTNTQAGSVEPSSADCHSFTLDPGDEAASHEASPVTQSNSPGGLQGPPLLEALPTPAAQPVETRLETVVPALPPVAGPPAITGFENAFTITHRGDSPMIRNWKMLGLHTFVAAVVGSTAFADEVPKANGDSKKLDEIQAQLKKLEDVPARLKSIETSVGVLATIQAELKELRKDLDSGAALANEKFKGLDLRVALLEEALKKVPDKKPDARIALSPPDAPPAAASNGDLKKISDSLESIVAELKALRTDLNAGAAGSQLHLRGLNEKIASLEKTMTAMREQIKFYQPAATPGAATTTTDKLSLVGRIRLRNDFVNPVSVVVNGKSRRLDPGETYTMNDVPAGTFSYEIIGIQARRLETLAANETYTITVYTR